MQLQHAPLRKQQSVSKHYPWFQVFVLISCTCRTNQVLQTVGSRSKSTENNKDVNSNNSKKKNSKKKEGTMHLDAEALYRAVVRSK